MDGLNKARWAIGLTGWMVVWPLLLASSSQAEGFRLEAAGVRVGVSASESGRDFHEANFFGNWNLPWGWDLGKGWHLQSRLDLSVGWLRDSGSDAAIGTAGPSLALSSERLPLSVDAGIGPTLLSDHVFATKDFGKELQFTSFIGLSWDVAAHWRPGYRFQHMSNAGLAARNPGLNMHMFCLSYRF